MRITEARQSGAIVVAPVGRVDSTSSPILERHLMDLLNTGERHVVVDLEGVDYISSAGLRVLLALAKRIKEGRGRLALCAMDDAVRQVFELAGFVPLFAIEASRDAALSRVQNA